MTCCYEHKTEQMCTNCQYDKPQETVTLNTQWIEPSITKKYVDGKYQTICRSYDVKIGTRK